MKKFLSLVLALVMTMSLVTISAGATDFADDADVTYDEAVSVISALGIVNGYSDDTFKPTNNLTRQAAAKIICNMILGPTTAAELHADTAPFPDVPVTNDFAGYIAYCAKEGIIGGYADGNFRGGEPLTGYAFMKMLLGALGYDGVVEGYTGANWAINVAKQAIGIGLNAGLVEDFNGVDQVNREEACLYAFNTLKATMVEYPENSVINVSGAQITLASAREDVAWGTGTLNDGKVDRDGFVQFAEKFFKNLTRTDDIDVFGRPANTWTYNKQDVGTFVDYTKLAAEWTVEVEGGDVYAAIGSVAADYDLTYWQDGVKMSKSDAKTQADQIAKKNDDTMGLTGNGVLTQVYVDNDAEELTIVEINTYLAETDDYNEKKETLKVDLYGYGDVETLKLEDFACIADYVDGDLILVTVANGEIQSIVDPETVEGTEISEFAKKDYVVADDTYSYAKTGTLTGSLGYALLNDYDKSNLDEVTFDLYFDTYGYLIGIEQVEADVEYVFITAIDVGYSALTSKTAEANAIFSDGTQAVIDVNMTKSEFGDIDTTVFVGNPVVNAWFSYTEKNDVYTLTFAENQIWDETVEKIDSKHVSQKDTEEYENDNFYYGNADTNYIVADMGKWAYEDVELAVISGVESVTTGVKNVSLDVYGEDDDTKIASAAGYKTDDEATVTAWGAYSVYKTGNSAYIIASIVIGDDGSVSDKYAYLYGEPKSEKYNKTEDCYYWVKAAVIDGEDTTVTFKTELPAEDFMYDETTKDAFTEGLYKLSYDKDGYAVGAVKAQKTVDYVFPADYASAADRSDIKIVRLSGARADGLDLTCVGDTLWITDQEAERGYALADECPAVIVEQDEEGEADKVVEYSTVAKAIKALDNYGAANNFDGMIWIFFEDGIATSVIITDTISEADAEEEVDGIVVSLKVSEDGTGLVLVTEGADFGTDEITYKSIAKDIRSGNEGVVKTGAVDGTYKKVVDTIDSSMTYIIEVTINDETVKVTL